MYKQPEETFMLHLILTTHHTLLVFCFQENIEHISEYTPIKVTFSDFFLLGHVLTQITIRTLM